MNDIIELNPDEWITLTAEDLPILESLSREYFPQNGLIEQVDQCLDKAYAANGHESNGHHATNGSALPELADLARQAGFGNDQSRPPERPRGRSAVD